MTTKLRHLIPALILAMTLPQFTAFSEESTGEKPPLVQWKILQRESPIENHPDIHNHFEFSLQLNDQKKSIFLAKAYLNPNTYSPRGFDEKSFQLIELAPNQLLHAKWTTISQGNGGYMHYSDIILAKHDSKWHVAFRDTHDGHSSGGAGDSRTHTLKFEFDLDTQILSIYSIKSSYQAGFIQHGKKENDDLKIGLYRYSYISKDIAEKAAKAGSEEMLERIGGSYYSQYYKSIDHWPCIVKNGALHWGEGTKSLDLGTLVSSIQEVVDFIQDENGLNSHRHISKEDMVQNTNDLNPSVKDDSSCTGIIVIQNGLAPYGQNRGHNYGGSA